MPHMDEPKAGGAAKRHDHSVGQPVQAGMPSGKRLVHLVPGGKIIRPVQTAVPGHAGLSGSLAVDAPHPASLAAAQLLHGQAGNILLREAQLVHLPHHGQVLAGVGDQFRLPQQQPGAGRQRAAMGIVAHPMLPHPDGTHAGVAHQLHGAVGHAGTGAKQQYRNGRCRDMDDALFICYRNGAVLPSQGAVFEVQKGHAVLDLRQGLQLRADHTGQFPHPAHPLCITVIKPRP